MHPLVMARWCLCARSCAALQDLADSGCMWVHVHSGLAQQPVEVSCSNVCVREVDAYNSFNCLLQADKLFLYEKFAPLGAILSVRVLTDETGSCRGVGFVNYADPRAASQARLIRITCHVHCCVDIT